MYLRQAVQARVRITGQGRRRWLEGVQGGVHSALNRGGLPGLVAASKDPSLACAPRRPRRRVRCLDSARVRTEHQVGDDPDRWAPPVCGREGEEADWAREGGTWAAGLGRAGGKGVWAGPKEIGKEREVSIFF